jgi:hypothetical protein
MSDLTKSLSLQSRAAHLHQQVKTHALAAVQCAVECGQVLLKVMNEGVHGDLQDFVQAAQIPRTTAYRYMKLAEAYQNGQLPDGLRLTALYRELGIIKSAEVGGPGSNVAKQGRSTLLQLEMCFNVFTTNLQTIRTVPFSELQKMDRTKLQATRAELVETLATLDNALKPTIEA